MSLSDQLRKVADELEQATGWKKGPLPPGTYGWGGVTDDPKSTGFYFADFCGDHVKVDNFNGGPARIIKAEEVAMYNNSLTLPPGIFSRTGG